MDLFEEMVSFEVGDHDIAPCNLHYNPLHGPIGSLSNDDNDGNGERHKTMGLTDEPKQYSARAFYILVHFFAVLCKQQREMTKF